MRCIAIGAGKGGVGKSSVTVNLALALASKGAKVGVLDADLYGPSMGKMIKIETPLSEQEGKIVPAQGLGLFVVSLAHLTQNNAPTIVRAPIANQMITEMLTEVKWPRLDYLLIDFPPGTGDIQLTLMQQAALSGAILVTTPQEVALLDVSKAYQMFHQMQVPIIGLVENMSYFMEGDIKYHPFGERGGERFAKERCLTLLGEVPIEKGISLCADHGMSLFKEFPHCKAAQVFEDIADKVETSLLSLAAKEGERLSSFELTWNQQT